MDAYQQAVEYLTENPSQIGDAWERTGSACGGCLFRFVRRGRLRDLDCGCLTMIRGQRLAGCCEAPTPELTAAIRADGRIPSIPWEIGVDHLPIFAGWQRRIDKILGRTPPPLDPRLPAPKGDIEIPEIELQPA